MNNDYSNATPKQLDSIIDENMGIVASVVKTFKPKTSEELEEYTQLGRIGLWKAIKKYDADRSAMSTNMWLHVKWEISRYLHNKKKKPIELQLDDSLELNEAKTTIDNLWEYIPSNITDDEKHILELRMMGHTFSSIGKILNKSSFWINKRYKKAIEKIYESQATHPNV